MDNDPQRSSRSIYLPDGRLYCYLDDDGYARDGNGYRVRLRKDALPEGADHLTADVDAPFVLDGIEVIPATPEEGS